MELMMTAPLSQDLRERIVHAVEGGSTMRQAARRFAVSASAAVKLMQRVRQPTTHTSILELHPNEGLALGQHRS